MDSGDHTSTTMTSVTEDTDEDSSCTGLTGTEQEVASSGVTPSDTNDEAAVDTTILTSPEAKVENAEIKMDALSDTVETDATCNKSQTLGSFKLPDFHSSEKTWYQHDCFKHFWQHYQFVSLWCQKHMEVYKTVRQQYALAPTVKFPTRIGVGESEPTSVSQQDDHIFKKPTVSKRTQRNRKARRRKKEARKRMRLVLNSSGASDSASSVSEKDDRDADEVQMDNESTDSLDEDLVEEQMEISEEMLDFFATTHKHRLERDALKKCERTKKEEKLVNIEEVRSDQKERTVQAPKEQPGSRRTAEMRLLYGKGAAMIHGMETALQMNFDRNLDVKQPKLWPNMPFRVVFNS